VKQPEGSLRERVRCSSLVEAIDEMSKWRRKRVRGADLVIDRRATLNRRQGPDAVVPTVEGGADVSATGRARIDAALEALMIRVAVSPRAYHVIKASLPEGSVVLKPRLPRIPPQVSGVARPLEPREVTCLNACAM
jgi:hypothetical protein